MKAVEKLLGDASPFLEKVFNSLFEDKIDASTYELDHLCYRVETNARYDKLKQKLSELGEMIGEKMINGRAIATIVLNDPIIFRDREINCIELPSPKEGSPYKEGYEHIELVIDKPFEEFITMYPELTFKTKAIDKEINPDIAIKYSDHAIKFHHNPLEYVVKYLED